jgi:enoyl-CoA hydratase
VSAEPLVVVGDDEGIRTLTLNRPEARNALSRGLLSELFAALDAAEADPEVTVVILTGADPAFCAGVDLKEAARGELRFDGSDRALAGEPGRRGPFDRISKPLIGAVNGVAVTGGLELALGCSFLVASERARFADTHTRVGVQPGWGLTILLPEAVGLRRAREMSATGNFVDAETALRWGLVNHVVSHEDLLPVCTDLAREVAGNDAVGVARLLRTYDENAGLAAGEAWAHEAEVAAAWLRESFSIAEIEARRQGVVDRGRGQARG